MFCNKCGKDMANTAMACPSCGAPTQNTQMANYLVQSILVTLCCCLPLGIVAIVYAAQVNSKLQAGDVAGAAAASKNAKMWCWIAFGLGLLANIVVSIIYASAIVAQIH